jgi:hypothetical protein
MPRWTKFVALFMLMFALFDVCSTEPCAIQLLHPTQNFAKIHTHQTSGGDCCQFEEDCFNCAHFAPGSGFVLQPVAVTAFAHPDLLLSSIEQPLMAPYHPPRA